MNSSVDWQAVKFDNVYEEELRALHRRRESDPLCTVSDLEKVLKNLYIMEGAEGVGAVHAISMAATIAAHEHFIAQWKKEIKE